MELFRIAGARHVRDLSGEGSRLYGGRWNRKGVPALYAAGNRALAAVEYLVHMDFPRVPKDAMLATIRFPDACRIEEMPESSLPPDWYSYPGPLELQEMGAAWLKACSSLALKLPSAVIRGESIYMLNPAHPDMARVKLVGVEDFPYDPRLLG